MLTPKISLLSNLIDVFGSTLHSGLLTTTLAFALVQLLCSYSAINIRVGFILGLSERNWGKCDQNFIQIKITVYEYCCQ